jgi:hypothetical protein
MINTAIVTIASISTLCGFVLLQFTVKLHFIGIAFTIDDVTIRITPRKRIIKNRSGRKIWKIR